MKDTGGESPPRRRTLERRTSAMTNLMQASRQWSSRPADERFVSLHDLYDAVRDGREHSVSSIVSTRKIRFEPHLADNAKGLIATTAQGDMTPTNWSFGQLSQLAGAPASYLKRLPAPMVADCVNYGLRFLRDAEDVGLLRYAPGKGRMDELRAATGPRYGRIWNEEIVGALIQKFGDGLTGDFRVPGEFGKRVPITRDNTTIYGSDRDIFVFLADEDRRIEVANRRDGQPGSLARGFFVWNSEVGSQSIGAAFFLFDYVCMNRIVWGVQEFREMRLRHTVSAPDRWLEEITPVLAQYAEASAEPVARIIAAAQEKKVSDDLDAFLAKRFTKSEAAAVKTAHEREEGRPIETLWDVVTGATAHAKTLPHQDARVAFERQGGAILDLAA
jgi:hypothetical protein